MLHAAGGPSGEGSAGFAGFAIFRQVALSFGFKQKSPAVLV